MSLFGLSCCCDEGFNGYDEVFSAESREDVLVYMLAEIKKYAQWKIANPAASWKEMPIECQCGDKYFTVLNSADWNPRVNNECIGFDSGVEQCGPEMDLARLKFILKATIDDLAKIIDNSYVDGDSSFEVSLIEIKATVKL